MRQVANPFNPGDNAAVGSPKPETSRESGGKKSWKIFSKTLDTTVLPDNMTGVLREVRLSVQVGYALFTYHTLAIIAPSASSLFRPRHLLPSKRRGFFVAR